MSADDPLLLTRRLQAEIEREADRLRRQQPGLARQERDIERAWAAVAPPGAAGSSEELLLDRVDRLAMVDVDAPLGARPGARQLKGAIRKGTYWYLRYLADQLNAFHGVQTRLLHRLDERLGRLERAAGLATELDRVLEPPPGPGRAVGELMGPQMVADGPVLVVSCGEGEAVAGLAAAGVAGYGVDPSPDAVGVGVDAGLDVRLADPRAHLAELPAEGLAGIVLGGFAERLPVAEVVDVVAAVTRVVRPGGLIVVAVVDPTDLPGAEAELLTGRGLSVDAWRLVGEAAGWACEVIECADPRSRRLLVGRPAPA